MTTRLKNRLIAFAVIGITAGLVVYGFPRNKWSRGRRVVDVNLSITDAGNGEPIAGATLTVFDHPANSESDELESRGKVAVDARAYDVRNFSTGADGSCRFLRVFPLYTKSLQQSKENIRRPRTWAKVSASGHIPVLIALDGYLPWPPKDSRDEKPLVFSVALVSGDEQPPVIPFAFPTVVNGFRFQWRGRHPLT